MARASFFTGLLGLQPRGRAIPFFFDDRIPLVEGSADNFSGMFTIDTGSSEALQLNAPFARRSAFFDRYKPAVYGTVGGGVGGRVRAALIRLHTFALGGVHFDELPIALSMASAGGYSDESIAGNVGNALLERFLLTLNYQRRTMYLERRPGSELVIDRSGIRVRRGAHGEVQIYSVLDGSPANKSGVLAGDNIGSIDGMNAGDLKLNGIRQKLSAAPGRVVHVRVVRGGIERQVDIMLRNLYSRR